MRRIHPWHTGLALLALFFVSPLTAQGPSAPDVIAAYLRLSARPPWPGFNPAAIPVAIFDGDTTWLSGHPHPPSEFRAGLGGLSTMAGRYPLVTANTSSDFDGASTATLILDRTLPRSALNWAAILMHEAFHVYQRAHHEDWTANEAELFTYPVEAEAPQRLQRLETEAWRRALTREQHACWARTDLQYRRLRFGLLPVGAVSYERGTELNEGLATYVELRAGKRDSIPFPVAGFAPDEMRLRGYTVGPAMGQLLDRFTTGWRERLERGPTRSLDELLADGLGTGEHCRYAAAEEDSIRALARTDVQHVHSGREALRDSVLSADGWRIEIVADSGSPLWPQRFDPWNVVALEGGTVVHRRFLQLAKDGLTVEVLNHAALTESAGTHPLFNGIRRLVVSGLKEEPTVQEQPGKIGVTAEGVRVEGRVHAVERAGRTIRLMAGP